MQIDKKYILLIILFFVLIAFEYFAPKEPNWSYSFSKHDKIPFGDYIIYDLLADVFPGKEISSTDKSLYNYDLTDGIDEFSYIVNTNSFFVDQLNLSRLLEMAQKGAKIFVSARYFEKTLSDTLGFTVKSFMSNNKTPLNFVHEKLKSDSGYQIEKTNLYNYFSAIDTIKTSILGTVQNGRANFIKIPFGKGCFYLHTEPIAFTNYNMLIGNNAEYVFKILAHVNNEHIVWDEHYKPGNKGKGSPLAYVFKQASLRDAYYLLLVLMVLFFVFKGKREQRATPLIEPPKNSSLEFAATLGNLYQNNKNHKEILLKRYLYWTDFLREKHFLHIEKMETDTAGIIAEKTGTKETCIRKILKIPSVAAQKDNISSDELLSFNRLIERFYKTERK